MTFDFCVHVDNMSWCIIQKNCMISIFTIHDKYQKSRQRSFVFFLSLHTSDPSYSYYVIKCCWNKLNIPENIQNSNYQSIIMQGTLYFYVELVQSYFVPCFINTLNKRFNYWTHRSPMLWETWERNSSLRWWYERLFLCKSLNVLNKNYHEIFSGYRGCQNYDPFLCARRKTLPPPSVC